MFDFDFLEKRENFLGTNPRTIKLCKEDLCKYYRKITEQQQQETH